MSRLYNWMMTRLSCCGCGCGIGIAFVGIAGTATGWLTWTVVT